MAGEVRSSRDDRVLTVVIDRPDVRNAIDARTAAELSAAFRAFDSDDSLSVAVLAGAGSTFSAGADLSTFASDSAPSLRVAGDGDAPLGVSRMRLSKPVIAAVEGYAVAGGFEIALWCDLRVASRSAVFGVFNRRFGIPLIDGGTIRLPRLIGQGRALDLILTGRPVGADEALAMGLVNRVVPEGSALAVAQRLGHELAALPQHCLRGDRMSVYEQWSLSTEDALRNETAHGMRTVESGETAEGALRFRAGEGRHGAALP
ncbi:MAG: crotonase/enoyl-CoA hydratase family protein [Candidatus Dormibacteraeota bacterium]|nr:crotonase/enoyl-CoA hydratase family protein [Candidatus Dormibacteraeota bacterium]